MNDQERMDEMIRAQAREYNQPPEAPREEIWAAIQAARQESQESPGLRVIAGGTTRKRPKGTPPIRRSEAPRYTWWGAAAAAVLLVAAGVGIGRWSSVVAPAPSERTASAASQARASAGATRVTTDHPEVEPHTTQGRATENRTRIAAASTSEPGARENRSRPANRSFAAAALASAPAARRSGDESIAGTAGSESAVSYQVATIRHLADAEALLTSFTLDSRDGKMDAQVAGWAKGLLSNTRLLLDSPAGDDPRRARLLQDLELVLAQIVQLSPGAAAQERELIRGSIQNGEVMTRLRTAIPAGPTRGL